MGRKRSGKTAQRQVMLDEIVIEGRHRKDMGDLDGLAESINDLGLLHPVVITSGNRLVAGQRRLEACRSLGWAEIPVTEITNLSDAHALLSAERDENTCREDMKPSEKVTLGKALEELERPEAEARKKAGNRIGGMGGKEEVGENFTPTSRGNTADIVGAAVGMSRPTYERAKLVVEASEDESLPDDVRAVAVGAREEMDRTGKVTPAHDKVAPLVGKKPAGGGTKRNGKGGRSNTDEPYEPVTERQHNLANAQKRRLSTAMSSIDGSCRGLEGVDLRMAFSVCTDDEREAWADMATARAKQLRTLAKSLAPEE